MSRKTYKIIMVIALIVSTIGLISFIGGIKPVNIGAFIFPALIAIWAFYNYSRKTNEFTVEPDAEPIA